MDLIAETRRVWIPNHPTEGYLPGRVVETLPDGFLEVADEAGGKFKLLEKEAQSVDPACLIGVDDLLNLGDFNEAALLHNIRVRYAEDKIYTGIGNPILISVNPYQNISGLYSAARMKEHRQGGAAQAKGSSNGGLGIHLYTIADAAYRAMLVEQSNQSIIISGESGAGKTEATKRVLAYLAEMQKCVVGRDRNAERTVEDQVLDANPVLEAFGNAKTVRNNNSSRFGKFIEVEFDSIGRLLSAQISNYLMEKSRIVTQQPDERNYHVFYSLCAGVATVLPTLSTRLKLTKPQDFVYTRDCCEIEGVDDRQDFHELMDCMTSLGITHTERDECLQVVAAVLHLGELEFTGSTRSGQDSVEVGSPERVALICDLLGLTVERLTDVLEHKTFDDPLTKETIRLNHNPQSASITRQSIAKIVYTRLFDWLVWRINQSIVGETKTRKDLKRIGLLDIYGFEVFDWNSFEQLCINFANEKLQQHFNSHMFTLEQRLYSSEGITWSHITFQDNQHIIDSLEKRPLGLFPLIDSECLFPTATDVTLHGKILNTFKTSKIVYKPGRFQSTDFAVAHYAGEVIYNTETFLEKNTDKLSSDITELLKDSKQDLTRKLFNDARFAPEVSLKSDARKNPSSRLQRGRTFNDSERQKQNVTVSMMFREQLDKLVEDLNKTNPRYIRCIKPNANKQPHEFDSIDVLRQLRCAGMLEAIRIRRAGYAVRRPFKDFFTRFRSLAPHLVAVGDSPDFRSLCQRLCADVEQKLRREHTLEEKPWQIGQTRLFMKEDLERHFERLLVEGAKHHVITLQKRFRGYKWKKWYKALKAQAIQIQAAFRTPVQVAAYRKEVQRYNAIVTLQAALRGAHARQMYVSLREARYVQAAEVDRQAAEVDRQAAEVDRQAAEAEREEQLRRQRMELSASPTLDADKTSKGVIGTSAMDQLRSELLARIGMETSSSHGTRALPTFLEEAFDNPTGDAPRLSMEGGRRTLNIQRDAFETMKHRFDEVQKALKSAQVGQEEVEIPLDGFESLERMRQTEEEIRRLRRENAALKADLLCSREEAAEVTRLHADLVDEVATLRAELEGTYDDRIGDRKDTQRRLAETLQTLQNSTEDLRRMRQRAEDADDHVTVLQNRIQVAENGSRARQERIVALENERAELEQQLRILEQECDELRSINESHAMELDNTRRSNYQEELSRMREKTDLECRVKAMANELDRTKEVLDDVMTSHVHRDDIKKWKAKCEALEKEYHNVIRMNRDATSAVGHMSLAAYERCSDIAEVEKKNKALQLDLEKKGQELTMLDLEKQDLQKQVGTLQSSCEYFQKQYKTASKELKLAQQERDAHKTQLAGLQHQLVGGGGAAPALQGLSARGDAAQQHRLQLQMQQQMLLQQQQQQQQRQQQQQHYAQSGHPSSSSAERNLQHSAHPLQQSLLTQLNLQHQRTH